MSYLMRRRKLARRLGFPAHRWQVPMTANPKIPLSRPSSRSQKLRDRLMRSGFLLGAILLHVILFLLVATWIIFAPPADVPEIFSFHAIVKPPLPPSPPSPPGADGSQKPLEPRTVVVPPSNPPPLVLTTAPTDFKENATTATLPNLTDLLPSDVSTSLVTTGPTGPELGINPFGIPAPDPASFSGTFYDLKQTPDHGATNMDKGPEQDALTAFCAGGWDEESFKKSYFSSSKPLFANEIMIPFGPSTGAPAAFGVQNECKPGFWCVVYHVKINPTRSGNFALAGFGDDYLVARVNGVEVLDSGTASPVTKLKRGKSYPPGPWLDPKHVNDAKKYGYAIVGDKFHVTAGNELSIDVLIADSIAGNGAGRCGYFLFLLEDRDYTAKDDKGNFVLPLLQIHPNPNVKRDGEYPPFSCNPGDALINTPPTPTSGPPL
jgi:hypothetical protein